MTLTYRRFTRKESSQMAHFRLRRGRCTRWVYVVLLLCGVWAFFYMAILFISVDTSTLHKPDVEEDATSEVHNKENIGFKENREQRKETVLSTIKDTRSHQSNGSDVDHDGCHFKETFEENLIHIKNYPIGDAEKYFDKMGANQDKPKTITSFPVFATAANSNFYDVSQALLKSLHEVVKSKYKDLKIIFYDLGLTEDQVQKLNKYCQCEVRTFPFGDFPPHVKRLKTYAWKPIIVQTLLMEFGSVWWMDTSIRFTSNDLNEAVEYLKQNSLLFFTFDPVLSVAKHTNLKTMAYLNEDPCKFRTFGEIDASFAAFHYDRVTRGLVRSWVACALTKDCIAPDGSSLICNIRDPRDGNCHRFDQSILSILLRRLYHEQNDYPLVSVPFQFREIKRGHRVQYFPE